MGATNTTTTVEVVTEEEFLKQLEEIENGSY